MRSFVAVLASLLSFASAALPEIPSESIARKKALLFSDDFESTNRSPLWHKVVPDFTVANGALVGSQARLKNATNDKGVVSKAHAAIHGLSLSNRDTVIEVKIRFDGASMIDIEFDDRGWTNSHYGHLCRAQFRTNGVTLVDERDGTMRNDIRAMGSDPSKKKERDKLLEGRMATFPVRLETNRWIAVVLETAGDSMRAVVDGAPVAFLKSSGIGHPTKSKLEFGVAGRTGSFDDLKIWNAESIAP